MNGSDAKNSPLQLVTYFLCILLFLFFTYSAFNIFSGIESVNDILRRVNKSLADFLFYDISGGAFSAPEVDRLGNPIIDELSGAQKHKGIPLPIIIVILVFGALYFTFYYGWINIRAFFHAIQVVQGKYDKEGDGGEISHFKALTSALSATVGLGNIAGVAVAIQLGGPGAVLWMILLAIFGMSSKFTSCTLGQLYRKINPDGTISGGPMYYLDIGISQRYPHLKPIGKFLAVLFAFLIMGGAIGGGNMFQSNQTVEAFSSTFNLNRDELAPVVGIIMAVLVGVVILGGIKRIGTATSKIVPIMCGLYILASITVLVAHITEIPKAFYTIFSMAFINNSFFGGFIGVMVMGFRRAAFSNEAGLGSASIAHAAAKTDEPIREGMVAMLGPFIDTIVICTMTALVIIVTGVWSDPTLTQDAANIGVTLTSTAFATVLPWFPVLLTICIALFAYSTMISWCYYGERGWVYLLDHFGEGAGLKTLPAFRLFFIFFTYLGAVSSLSDVINFSDLMILSMAFPNIVGSIILAPRVKEMLKDYWSRYQSGQFSQR